LNSESQKVIKEALDEKGELPLTWECGCDSSILNFAGWSDNWSHLSSTLQTGLRDLSDHIVDQLNLPGAGPVMDEGEGRVFRDSDGTVKLVYSSRYVSYEIPDVELAEVLREKNDFAVAVDALQIDDFSFNLDIDEDTRDKSLLANLNTKPELEESIKIQILACLNEHFPDFETPYWMTNKRSNSDYLKCRSLEIYGSWTLLKKQMVITKWCGVEYLEHDLKEQQVSLF